MTVRELVEILQRFDGSLDVVCASMCDEGGLFHTRTVALTPHPSGPLGQTAVAIIADDASEL